MAVALAACAGPRASAESTATAMPPRVAPAAGAPVDAAVVCTDPATWLDRLNRMRAAGAHCGAHGPFPPASALVWDARLADAAHRHAVEMAARGDLTHRDARGGTASARARAAGYRYRRLAENLAAGQPDVPAVVADWMASDGHCANLMDARLTEVAAACAAAPGDPRGMYWAALLGSRR